MGTDLVAYRFGILDGTPLAIVSRALDAEFSPRSDPQNPLAEQVHVTHDGSHPTAVVLFHPALGLTDLQLRTFGHALSHVVARLLRLPDDPTDVVPCGVRA